MYSSILRSMFAEEEGVLCVPIRLKKIDKVDSNICFEMSFSVVEAIRGRCASFTVLTVTV